MDALSKYLEDEREKLSAFATRIGRSPSTLSRALSGQRDPSVDLARDVEIGSCGKVSALQFLEICLAAQRTVSQGVAAE
jgi:transcriptional regulator with XRE-family HTH domain